MCHLGNQGIAEAIYVSNYIYPVPLAALDGAHSLVSFCMLLLRMEMYSHGQQHRSPHYRLTD
jgi:hypothetical protein